METRGGHYREVYNTVCVNEDTHEADPNKLDLIEPESLKHTT